MTVGADMPKVSVVIPAYNCGANVDRLVASLRRQSLPAGEFEVIFVDDGSTDGTPQRLDELAAAHPHIQVLHQENSGWPSRPRNVGVERARGDYVFFADDDDWFGDEALERLHACAREHDADIVVGKMAGHGRAVPRELFRQNRFDATPANAPLIDSLTCHKLFRRSFLLEHRLQFSEGPYLRLEDHRMVVRAYLLSRRTCVLSDYTCYHHYLRSDQTNVTAKRFDPTEYYASLREALEIVNAHVPPGPLRDRLHRRWLRNEMLDRLRGRRLLDAPEGWVEQIAREIQEIIRDRLAPGVAAGLPPLYRALARLAEEGRVADLRRLAEWEVGVRAHGVVDRWAVRGSTLTLTFSAQLRAGDRPLRFGNDPHGLPVLPVGNVEPTPGAATPASPAKLDLVARRQETQEEIFVPVTVETERVPAEGGLHVLHKATATVDFAAFNSGRTRGTWQLRARVTSAGWTRDVGLALLVHCATDGAPPQVEYERAFWSRLRRLARRLGGHLPRTAVRAR
ncbi:Glycosyltransferase involved in cell wall bisynthesis [Micromonospora viridifaciens]|uniref:Glycosyltransferase involved in cell wall bisynthesis n=1 Tax=Micromonospora viridifaciens TaxID=1881 RepID=A0A1C4V6F5_MICVI|nr:glycosyltransferase family 2 protein [Micromonospora viridifaciens]SCE79411.1 Glycosyltransferase involved in cell wall bisynthesis [Micromonospora viridifaciens]